MTNKVRILPLVFIIACAPLVRMAHGSPKFIESAKKQGTKVEAAVTINVTPVPPPPVETQQPAPTQQPADNTQTTRAKAQVALRLVNKKTRVKVKIRNVGEVKGWINDAESDRFTLTEEKTGKKFEVSYGSVEKLSGRGMGLGTKFLIAGVAVVGAIVILAVLVVHDLKNFGN